MLTVLTEAGASEVTNGQATGNDLWLEASDANAATGWQLKPEGLCQGDICVPVPAATPTDYVRDGRVNIAAFWRLLDRPVLHDAVGATWMLGAAAGDRARVLESLVAPDFTLPDLNGTSHTLSDYRGKRVLLTTWSSW